MSKRAWWQRVQHLAPVHFWHCPKCHTVDVTREIRPHTRYHECAAMGGLKLPMLVDGQRAKLEVFEREDYVKKEMVQVDGRGRPVMAVHITTDQGEHRIVYAPTAVGGRD